MMEQECLDTAHFKYQAPLLPMPIYPVLKIGDRITITVNLRGWRKFWAKIRRKPISEVKEFVCTTIVTSDEQSK
jgi:hypothetical protein